MAAEPAAAPVRAYWLGSVPYTRAWDLQRALVGAVRAGTQPDSLLLLEHPHVFSIGRRGTGENLLWTEAECARRGVEVIWTDRGGDVTYHGPGQLVGYPILDLPRLGSDILRHIRTLELSLISFLATFGIHSEPGGPGLTGIWSRATGPAAGAEAEAEKVAAIGVKLNQHVTNHGFALNLTTDLEIFNEGIVPCGLEGRRATSLAALGGPQVTTADAAAGYAPHFADSFGVSLEWGDPAELPGRREPNELGAPDRSAAFRSTSLVRK